jgi:hypothetical protein
LMRVVTARMTARMTASTTVPIVASTFLIMDFSQSHTSPGWRFLHLS